MIYSYLHLLVAVLLLELGSGLQGVLIPIRGELAGFPTTVIGGLGTAYYLGFVIGCLILPQTVRRFGHIRCFSALASIAASIALLHALFVLPSVWLIFRVSIGFCFAGLFMVIESWLNDHATIQNRGRVLGAYMVATWLGVIGGKLLFSIALPNSFDLFAVASIAIGLSLVPIALTTAAAPAIPEPGRMGLRELYRTAPVGLVGCIIVGLANGAFWTFAPIYAQAWSSSSFGVSLFMSACVIGGALSQWPIGRFSDKVDRRWVIFVTCLAAAILGLLLAWQQTSSENVVLPLAGLFGATALSLYSVCVAHANDRADPATFVEVSSHLLLAFGLGAIIGPFLVGLLISEAGIESLFFFTASMHVALGVFVLARIKSLEPTPEEGRVVFAAHLPISHGTQAIIELHQSTERNQSGAAEEELEIDKPAPKNSREHAHPPERD